MERETSVASDAATTRQARIAFWAIGLTVAAIKLFVANALALFGDEAFYWQESRQLAWSYTDVPPATAWLIRLGETLFGHSLLGVRSLFLLLGTATVVLVWQLGRRLYGERAGVLAALGWQLLPLAGTLGVMAMPDVPLSFAAVLMLYGLAGALRGWRRAWLWLGLGLLLAWLSHYRAALLLPGGLGLLLFEREGRALWRRAGLWFAAALGSCGLLPLLLFNRSHDWSGLSFQLVERHPWQFHASGLLQPLEQLLIVTPLLYALLLWALLRAWRRRRDDAVVALFAWSGLAMVLVYFVFGLFGDDLRFRWHWPLQGYVPALLLLALYLTQQRLARGWLLGAYALAGLGLAVALAYLLLAATPSATGLLARYKAFPYNFVGWNEVADATREVLRYQPARLPLVADNFLLAAELDFQFDGKETIYVLDHPRNVKHGRAPQLALWRRDEQGLRQALAGQRVLLVVEETAGSERERQAWLQGLCRRLDALEPQLLLKLFDGRKVFSWYSATVPAPGVQPDCPAEAASGK